MLLPNALNCGCNYELFWHLNPRKIEPFFEARRQKEKEEMERQDSFAWLLGTYTREAVASCFNKTATYPSEPRGLSKKKEEATTDAEKFRLFAIQHNKTLARERKLHKKSTQ